MSEPERTLISGGDPDEPYHIPFFGSDFAPAPDLELIAKALIESCEEFEDIDWAIRKEALSITYVWKKKGAKSDNMVRTGALAKTGGMVKHFAGAQYVIGLSADANFGRTRFQIEAEIFHQLTHIRIGRKTVGKGDDKRTIPVLKKRAHDLEMFFGEVKRYGLWRSALKRGDETFSQARLPIDPAKPERKRLRADGAASPPPEVAEYARVQRLADRDGVTMTLSTGRTSATIAPRTRGAAGIIAQETVAGAFEDAIAEHDNIPDDDSGDVVADDFAGDELDEGPRPEIPYHPELAEAVAALDAAHVPTWTDRDLQLVRQLIRADELLKSPALRAKNKTLRLDERRHIVAQLLERGIGDIPPDLEAAAMGIGEALERSPEEVAAILRSDGLPVKYDGGTECYVDPVGNLYDGGEGWAGREAETIAHRQRAQIMTAAGDSERLIF